MKHGSGSPSLAGPQRAVLGLESARWAAASCELVPCSDSDLSYAYGTIMNAPERWPRLALTGSPSPYQFRELVWNRSLAVFTVYDSSGPAAIIPVYDVSHHSRTAWLEFVPIVPTRWPSDTVADESVELVVEYVAYTWVFRKLYRELTEFQVWPAADRGWAEEAKLRNYYWWDGRHWDRNILARYICDGREGGAS